MVLFELILRLYGYGEGFRGTRITQVADVQSLLHRADGAVCECRREYTSPANCTATVATIDMLLDRTAFGCAASCIVHPCSCVYLERRARKV